MRNILIVSICPMRGSSIGLIGDFLLNFRNRNKYSCQISLLDIGFFDIEHNPASYAVDYYYSLPKTIVEPLIRKIPWLRTKYAERLAILSFKRIIKNNRYDLVVLYQIPMFADKLTEIAHSNGVKIAFVPWGSDILRVSAKDGKRLLEAFSEVDYVVGAAASNTIIAAKEKYNVPCEKIVQAKTFVNGVQSLMKAKGILSREEMSENVGIPYSDFNIVCSYNGYNGHRHKTIINAVLKNKDVLPHNYQLVFPMTYGATPAYIDEIKKTCHENGLNAVFLLEYLSNEQIAYLHHITDLFVEIQPTDNGNAFMIEALCAENKIITGRWLGYKQFEQFGVPYYLIDKLDELPQMLRDILTHQVSDIKIPNKLLELFTFPEGFDGFSIWNELLAKCN